MAGEINYNIRQVTGGLAQAGAWLVRHLSVEQPLPLSSKPQWNPPPAAKPLGR